MTKLGLERLKYRNCLVTVLSSSLPPLPTLAVNKHILAFLLSSHPSISDWVAIYHTAADQIAVISVLLYVLHTSDFFICWQEV